MPEADDDRMAETTGRCRHTSAGSCRRRRPRSSRPSARVGSICTNGNAAVSADLLRERRREGLGPAAVVADEVRLLPGRPGEVRDGRVAGRRPGLVDTQVRGRLGGSDACTAGGLDGRRS